MAPEQRRECPRCGSTDTRFCWYNGRQTNKPKHFCSSCNRYWIHGGCRLVSKSWKRAKPAVDAGRDQAPEVENRKEDESVVVRFLEWAGALLDPTLRLDYHMGGGEEEEQEQEEGVGGGGGVWVPEDFRPLLGGKRLLCFSEEKRGSLGLVV